MKRFLFFFSGRTGSSFLLRLLGQHPGGVIRGELLADVRFSVPKLGTQEIVEKLAREYSFNKLDLGSSCLSFMYAPYVSDFDLFYQFYSQEFPPETRVAALKTKFEDISNHRIMKLILDDLEIKCIHLRRRSITDQVISHIISRGLRESIGESNVMDSAQIPSVNIAPDPAMFYSIFKRIIESEKRICDGYGQYIVDEVYYEDMLSNLEQVIERTSSLLGLDDFNFDHSLMHKKIISKPVGEYITNFDAICDFMNSSDLADEFLAGR